VSAVRLADGDIFTEPKPLAVEMSAFIQRQLRPRLRASASWSWGMCKMANLIDFVGALTNDAADLAMGFPGRDVNG